MYCQLFVRLPLHKNKTVPSSILRKKTKKIKHEATKQTKLILNKITKIYIDILIFYISSYNLCNDRSSVMIVMSVAFSFNEVIRMGSFKL